MNSTMEIRTNNDLRAFERRIQSLEQRVGEIESRLHPVVEDQIALYLTIPDSLR